MRKIQTLNSPITRRIIALFAVTILFSSADDLVQHQRGTRTYKDPSGSRRYSETEISALTVGNTYDLVQPDTLAYEAPWQFSEIETDPDPSSRRAMAEGATIVSLENRIRDTLEKQGIYKEGDTFSVDLSNIKISAGPVKIPTTHSEKGFDREIEKYPGRINRGKSETTSFNVGGENNFQRTFSAVVQLGLRWNKGDIKAVSRVTPGGKSSSEVTFSLSKKNPSYFKKPVTVSFRWANIRVPPRTRAEPTGAFQVSNKSGAFECKLRITADGKVKALIKPKQGNKNVDVLMTLREALAPNQGGGFKVGKDDDEVFFIAKGRNNWSTTEKVLLQVKLFSLDGKDKDSAYKTAVIEDIVDI